MSNRAVMSHGRIEQVTPEDLYYAPCTNCANFVKSNLIETEVHRATGPLPLSSAVIGSRCFRRVGGQATPARCERPVAGGEENTSDGDRPG